MGSLKGLRTRYLSSFDAKIAELRESLDRMGRPDDPAARSELRRRLHTLAGSGEVYGLPDITTWARDLLKALDAAPSTVPADAALLSDLDTRIDVLEALVTGLRGDVLSDEGRGSSPPRTAELPAAVEEDGEAEPLPLTRRSSVPGVSSMPSTLSSSAASGLLFAAPIDLPASPSGAEDWRVAVPNSVSPGPDPARTTRPLASDEPSGPFALPRLPEEDLVPDDWGTAGAPAAPIELAPTKLAPIVGRARTVVGLGAVSVAQAMPTPTLQEAVSPSLAPKKDQPVPKTTVPFGVTLPLPAPAPAPAPATDDAEEDEILPESRVEGAADEPAGAAAPAAAESPPPAAAAPTVTAALTPETAEYTVLVIDHDLHVHEEVQRLLDAKRFRVIGASSTQASIELARQEAPDLVLLDADIPGEDGFATFDRLRTDPLTSFLPVVFLTSRTEFAERARALVGGAVDWVRKPYDARDLARKVERHCAHTPLVQELPDLGEATLEEVVEFVSSEMRRGLLQSAERSDAASVVMGQGAELLATTWGAIGRLREVVARLSSGKIRFRAVDHGRLGVLLLHADEHVSVLPTPPAGPLLDLGGRRVLVADDDPAVRRLFGSVLEEVGAKVDLAEDGRSALAMARANRPDVVVSDILMPEMDGWELCRALRRDFGLRDVPVILLSWKEDFVQRMRELDARADAYLLKESQKPVILERIRSVLRPRMLLEQRLGAGGEVSGRVDQVGIVTLLRAVCRHRGDAKVRLRENWNLFELEVRAGVPVSAIRTSTDGTLRRGTEAFDELVAADGGRFTVLPTGGAPRPNLTGSLDELVAASAGRLGHLVSLVVDAALLRVTGVTFRTEALETYLSIAPERVREIVRRLERGEPPREILDHVDVGPQEMERVLVDLVKRGAVHAILAPARPETPEARKLDDEDRWKVLSDSDASEEPDILGEQRLSQPPAPAPQPEEHTPIEDEARKSLAPAPPVVLRASRPSHPPRVTPRTGAWTALVLLTIFGMLLWGYILFGGPASGVQRARSEPVPTRALEPAPPPVAPQGPAPAPPAPVTVAPSSAAPAPPLATTPAPETAEPERSRERDRPGRQVGTLSVVASGGDEVFVIVDDRPRGRTPLSLQLPEGLHEIGLRRGDTPPVFRYVVVRGGEETTLSAPRLQ